MGSYLGESTSGAEPVVKPDKLLLEPVKLQPPELLQITRRQEPKATKDIELASLVKDFKVGLGQLGQAAEQLAKQRPLERLTPQQLLELKKQAPSLMRILEREMKTFTKLVKAAPDIKHTETITKAYRDRAERVIEQHLPQLYASILKAEQLVTKVEQPQVAIPLKPGAPVAALVAAAKAIRAGRLPFVPLETRKQAQHLIDSVFIKTRMLETSRKPDASIRQLIERHSLIPLAVRHDVMRDIYKQTATGAAPVTSISDKQILRTVQEIIRERATHTEKETNTQSPPMTVVTRNAPRLTQALPSFQTQGVAAGGDYLAHAGENIHVISRQDSSLVAPYERTAPGIAEAAPAPAINTKLASAVTAPAPTMNTRPAAAIAAPMPAAPIARPASGPAITTGIPAGGSQTTKLEGTLKIEGLSDWIGKIEARTKEQ